MSTWRRERNGHSVSDSILNVFYWKEMFGILIEISLSMVSQLLLVQVILGSWVWRQADKLGYPQCCDVIMSAMASHITSIAIVYSTNYSGADHRKYQSFASLAFVRGIHRWPVNFPRKGPVTRNMFPFDDVIMNYSWRRHVICILICVR